ncbi:Transcription factor vrtR2 [Talaromyces pinophilus]|nr:Transcription factor vrtR2 [Talaromyces pinophilus]
MAVRVAQALSLHVPHPTFAVSAFEQEMRRRLIAIGLLDVQASLDQASEPMILTSWLQSHPPTNINDNDISTVFQRLVQQSGDFTDTTFALMILKAQCIVRLFNVGDTAESPAMHMETRQAYVADFKQTSYKLLRNCYPESDPFHWYARRVADCVYASLQLIALRPLQRNAKLITPSPICGLGILKLSVEVLQKMQELYDDIRGHPWRWFEGIFVPWHALAVALAELCELEDLATMEIYWLPTKHAFDRFSSLVADSRQAPMRRNHQLADSPLSGVALLSEDSLSAVLDWNLPFLRTPMEADGGEEQVQGAVVASGDGLGSWPNSWDLQRNIDWPSDFHPWTYNNL